MAGNYRSSQHHPGQNVFSGFDPRLLSEAFVVSWKTVQKLQSQNGEIGDIMHVNHTLKFLKPTQQRWPESYPHIQYEEGQSQAKQSQGDQSERAQSQSWQSGQSQEGQSQEGPCPGWQSHAGQSHASQSTYDGLNGLEENFCNHKISVNIDDPSRTDIYNPRAGTISHLNSQTFPILNIVQMGATRVNLYQVYMILNFAVLLFIYSKIHTI